MPFQKGNTIWKEGVKARRENQERKLDLFFSLAAEGGAEAYANKLDKLERGEKLSESEELFMKKYENLFEYMQPKRARVDGKGETAEGNTINIINYKNAEE